MTKRVEKKSETIEVRVSYSEKLAFMEACKQAGTTASHAIRGYIDDFLHPKPELRFSEKAMRALPVSGFLLISTLFVGFLIFDFFKAPTNALASANGLSPTNLRVLNHFDQDGDGYLSSNDLSSLEAAHKVPLDWLLEKGDQNNDGRIDAQELQKITNITIEMRASRPFNADKDQALLERGSKENIFIIPPDLTEEERQAYLEKSLIGQHMNEEDLARFKKMLDAFLVDGTE